MNVDKVEKGIYKYGFYPMLFLLKEFQDKEEFEKCAIIKQALVNVGSGREWYLSTQLDDKTLSNTYKNYYSNRNITDTMIKNYIEELRDYLDTE